MGRSLSEEQPANDTRVISATHTMQRYGFIFATTFATFQPIFPASRGCGDFGHLWASVGTGLFATAAWAAKATGYLALRQRHLDHLPSSRRTSPIHTFCILNPRGSPQRYSSIIIR